MRKFLISALTACLCSMTANAITFENETLNYRVTYKWGLIQKDAGSAWMKLTRKGDKYNATLAAATLPWADKIFCVRDTLTGTFDSQMRPLRYVKSTHEGGDWRHDTITYTYNYSTTTGKCHRYKRTKKGNVSTNDTILTSKSTVVDMLSVYYYVRQLPFETMKSGQTSHSIIFSAKKKENLTITYKGIEDIEVNGKKYHCYKIHFRFTSERMKDSSAPMEAWLTTDGTRVPVKLVGELSVGKIQIIMK